MACIWKGQMDADCTRQVVWMSADGRREYCSFHADMFTPLGLADLRHVVTGEPYMDPEPDFYPYQGD
ncbi:MAG: hypothetical protein KAJ19_17555 [Gammaproteobacteria bacterium]|nr:hypothetical protein [Gammaproteobacteria bacterium]